MNGINYVYWYVLFVKTGCERNAIEEINYVWKKKTLTPFIPMYETNYKKAGKVALEKRSLFPGYVFVETDIADNEFVAAVNHFISNSKYIYKILNYESACGGSYAMKEAERNAFMVLYGRDYCIQMSKGLIEGDKIIIKEGALLGHESRIKHINRHKYEAVIELEILGNTRDVKVGLEIIRKI